MPRKAFVADLKEAVESSSADNIFDLKAGDEDGSFTFEHRLSAGASPSVTVQALISGKTVCLHLKQRNPSYLR